MPTTTAPKKAARSRRAAVPAADTATGNTATAVDALTDIPAGVHEVSIDLIDPHPHNPRKDLGDLTELAQSIREHGVQQNLTLVPHPETPGRFRTVIGHRRTAAAREAGLTTVPAAVRDWDAATQIQMMLIENGHRSDLKPSEEAQAMFELFDTHKVSKAQIAKRVAVSKKTVDTRIRIAGIDDTLKVKLDAQQLSIEDVLYVDEIRGMDPDLFNETLKQLKTDTGANAHGTVARARQRYSDKQRRDTVIKQWADKGVEVIVGRPDYDRLADPTDPMCTLRDLGIDKTDTTNHRGVVVYCDGWALTSVNENSLQWHGTWVCTDAATHYPTEFERYTNYDEEAERAGRQDEVNAQIEANRAAYAARQEAKNAATTARIAFVLNHIDDPRIQALAYPQVDMFKAGAELILNNPENPDIELPKDPALAALAVLLIGLVDYDAATTYEAVASSATTSQDDREDYEQAAMDYLVALADAGYEPTVEADAIAKWRELPATAPDEDEAGDES